MALRLTLRTVFLLAMLALVLLGAAVYSVIAYQVRKTDLVQGANVRLLMAGHVARTVVGPGYHDRITDPSSVSKEEFARIVATYDELCQQLGLQYIWSLMELDGQLVFTSATHTVLTNQHSACATFLEVHTKPEAYRHALATMQPEFATFRDKWGAGRMVLLPGWDQHHRRHLFAASVQLAGFEALLSQALRESVLVSLIVAALFSLLALLLARQFTRPLTRLTLAIERMGRGELDHPLAAGGVQELQRLADTFDAMRQTVRRQVGALRDSEERYRSLVEHLGIGVTLLSPTLEVLALNRQMREWNPSIRPESRPLCYCAFNDPPRAEVCTYCPVVKTLQDGEVHEAVTDTPRGGSVVNYRIVSSPLKDEAGQVRGVIEMVEDITARKQLEESLRASELRFRALVDNTFDAITVLRPDGTYLYASPAAERISGYSQAELLSSSAFALIHPDDLPGVQQHFQQLVQQPDATVHLDFRARHRDGSWRWIEAHGVNQLAHPAIGGVVVNYRDITARKQAEEALQQSQADLSAITESTEDIIFLMDAHEGRLQQFNSAFAREAERTYGVRLRVGMTAQDILPAERMPVWAVLFQRVLTTYGSYSTEYLRPSDQKYFEVSFNTIRTEGQLSGVSVFIHDITARKRAEQALRESEEKFRSVVTALSEGIVVHSAGGEIIACNPAAERILGLTEIQMKGKTSLDPDWRSVHEDGSPFNGDDHPAMVSLRTGKSSSDVVMGVHTPTGEVKWISINTAPVLTAGKAAPYAVIASFADITARKAAEAQLRASEERYRLLADNSEDLVSAHDAQNNRLYVSPSYYRVTGWTPADLEGSPWDARLHPEDLPALQQARAANRAGHSTVIEHRILCRNGSWLWVEARCKPVMGPDGQMQQLVIWSRDITERKAAEEAMRLSQAQLAAVLESTQDMIWSVDAQTFAILAFNAACARFIQERFGITLQPLMTAREILPADRFEFWEQQMQRAIREGPLQVEYPLPGTAQLLEIVFNPIRSEGRVVALSVFAKDISARKQAEEALRQSEEKYRALIETTNTGYLILDAQGMVIDANEAYVRLTGHAALAEILGRSVVEWTAPHDRERNAREVAQCLAQGFVRNLEVDYVDRNGKFTPIEINATVMGSGVSARVLALCRDITARKAAQAALRQSEEKYRALVETTNTGFLILDAQGTVVDANEAYIRLAGHDALEEIRGRSITEWTAPHDRERNARALEQCLTQGFIRNLEVDHVDRGGQLLPVEINATIVGAGGSARVLALCRDITARKRAEEALRASEAQLTSVVESTSDRIWTVDVDTLEILSFNTAFAEEMLQTYGLHIWPGINMREFLPPERVLFWAEHFQRVIQQGRLTLEYFRPNNAKYFEMTFNPIRKDEGVHRLSIFARDITQRRRAELALRVSEEKYTRLVTHIEDVLYSVDAVTREFRYLSPAFQKMFGYTLEDIRQLGGRRAFMAYVIQGGQFKEQDDYLQKLQREPAAKPFRSVAWWRCKDGTQRYVRDNWMPVYEAGQLVSTEGILTDITREKAAEDKLQESEALLKEAQQLAKLGNWNWDVGTGAVTWSDELYEMWGLNRSQPAPSLAQHVKLFPPECWPRVQALLQHAAQTGEEYVLETEFLRQDGTRGHLLAHGLSSRDKDGRVLRLYGTAQDVTERKRLQQQLLEISEREQRRIGQDLHDGVGQQLAAMRFQSSTLLQKLAQRKKVSIAEVERLDTMLEETLRQVRDLSRGLHPVSVDSHGLMHGLRELARQSLALFGVPCVFDCADTVLVLDQRAAVNLYRIAQEAVRNAAVHGAPKQIRIQLAEAGGLLLLTIQDDGCGLPPDLKAASGLGLEIMRYRASSIGATCEILSQPGAGVTVQCGWRAPT
jgi:PAS domain S-box-containing protein